MADDDRWKITTAGQLTRLDIGNPVGVTMDSGAYVRDTLLGVIYGAEANRDERPRVSDGCGPFVLLAFTNTVPADQPWDSRTRRYFRVHSSAVATVFSVTEPDDAGRES